MYNASLFSWEEVEIQTTKNHEIAKSKFLIDCSFSLEDSHRPWTSIFQFFPAPPFLFPIHIWAFGNGERNRAIFSEENRVESTKERTRGFPPSFSVGNELRKIKKRNLFPTINCQRYSLVLLVPNFQRSYDLFLSLDLGADSEQICMESRDTLLRGREKLSPLSGIYPRWIYEFLGDLGRLWRQSSAWFSNMLCSFTPKRDKKCEKSRRFMVSGDIRDAECQMHYGDKWTPSLRDGRCGIPVSHLPKPGFDGRTRDTKILVLLDHYKQ